MQVHLFLTVLLSLILITLEGQTTTFGYKIPEVWGAHHISMSASPTFTQSGDPYIFNKTLGKTYQKIKYIAVAKSGHFSNVNYYFGFDISAYALSDPTSVVYMNLTIDTNSQFTYFSFSILIIAESFNQYFWVTQISITTPGHIYLNYTTQYPVTSTTQSFAFLTSLSVNFSYSININFNVYASTVNSKNFQVHYYIYNQNILKYLKGFVLFVDEGLYPPWFNNIQMYYKIADIQTGDNLSSLCIKNSSLFSPNYDGKCLIGYERTYDMYAIKSRLSFDLNSSGIYNFYTNQLQQYKTICLRRVDCPETFPYYDISGFCFDCSDKYSVVNGTLPPEYCLQLTTTTNQFYYNYSASLTYVCAECVLCSNQSYLDTNLCYICNNRYPFCIYCNQTVCTECDEFHYVDQSQNSSCIQCGVPIRQCVKCTNDSVCLQCRLEYEVNQFGKCQCIIGWNVTNTCTTIIGCVSSHKINNITRCLACGKLFRIVNNNCSCKRGYSLTINDSSLRDSYCEQTCGDGILINDECDDGNTVNGDGCSDNCTIEAGFICFGGSFTSVSICGYQTSFTISIYSILINFGENTGLIKVKINPNLKNLKYIKWNELVSQSLTDGQISLDFLHFDFDQSLGNLQILVNLSQTIEKQKTNLKICYDPDQYSAPCNQIDFQLKGMNAPLNRQSFINHHQILIISSYIVGIMCGLIAILSFFKYSYIGVENVLTFMVIYFSRLLSQNKNSVLVYCLYPLRYAAGFNDIFADEGRDYHLQSTATRYKLSGQFFIFMNLSGVILLIFLTIYTVFKVKHLRLKLQFQVQITGREVSHKVFQPLFMKMEAFYYNFLYPFVLLNIYLIVLTSVRGTFLTKSYIYQFSQIFHMISFCLFLLIYFTSAYFYVFEMYFLLKLVSDQKLIKIKSFQGRVDSNYNSFLTLSNVFSVFFLLFTYGWDTQNSDQFRLNGYIYLGFSLFFLIILLIWRPYFKTIHNVGIIYNQSVVILFVGFLVYVKYFATDISIINVILLYCFIILLFGTNVIGFIRILSEWSFSSLPNQKKKKQTIKKQQQTSWQKKKTYNIQDNPYYYRPYIFQQRAKAQIQRQKSSNKEVKQYKDKNQQKIAPKQKSLAQIKAELRESLKKRNNIQNVLPVKKTI